MDDFSLANGKATGGNDLYIAVQDAALTDSNTYNSGDAIDAGTGIDTLQLTVGAAAAVTTNIKNVEVLELRTGVNGLAATPSFDMANNTDKSIKTIKSNLSTANTVVNNIAASDVAFELSNLSTTATFSDFNWMSGQLTGAADAVSLKLNNVDVPGAGVVEHTVNFDGAAVNQGFETVNIETMGVASALAALNVRDGVLASTLRTLNVTGDKNLTIGGVLDFAGATGTGTVDASKFTGNLNVNLNNGDNVTVTGGKGNDTFDFGASLTGTDKVDGGDGKDTLAADTFAAIQGAVTAGVVSNIEAIRINTQPGANSTMDVSRAGNVNEIGFTRGWGAAGVTTTVNNLQDNAVVNVDGDQNTNGILAANIKDATLAANTSNTVTVNVGGSGDANVDRVGQLDIQGVENLNVNLLGTAAVVVGNDNTMTVVNPNNFLQTVTVTGAENFALTYAGATLKTYDASASAGMQTTTANMFANTGATIKGGSREDALVGSVGNDTIEAGAGDDTITGGLGADKITTGTGADRITASWNGNTAGQTNTTVDTVTDFTVGSGGDVINLADLGNANIPVLNGVASAVTVSSLTSALPATTADAAANGRAELIILDSATLTAADSQALNALLFNLGGSADYTNVVVAYAASNGGDVRLATATIGGGDINNVRDMMVLQGVTTASLAAGFNQANLIGFGTAGATLTANAQPFNTLTGVGITGALTAGAGNDTINATNAQADDNASVIDGAGGVNTLIITDNANGLNLANQTTAVANISNINLAAGSTGNATMADLAQLTVTNTSAAAAATVTLGTGAQQNYVGNGQIDTVTLGNVAQSVTTGAGADVITAGGVLTGSLNGGADLDTLTLNAASTLTGATLTDIETLTAGAFNVLLTAAQYNAFTTAVDAAGGAITFSDNATVTHVGGTAALYQLAAGGQTINAGQAVNYNITGGAGADTINLTANVTAADSVNGGNGVDTVNLTGNLGAINMSTNTSNVEVVNLLTASAGAVTVGVSSNVTTTAGAQGSLAINLSGASQIVASYGGGSTAGALITGSAGADTITGGGQADTINGAAGNDQINALAAGGNDRWTGGTGNDTFVLSTAQNTFSGIITITDFTPGAAADNDLIQLDLTTAAISGARNTVADIVTADGLAILQTAQTTAQITGTLSAAAAANNAIVVFNTSTGRGEVWFDTDWTTTADRVQIATLDNIVTLAGVTGLSATNGVDFNVL